jgi:hypothetical protein
MQTNPTKYLTKKVKFLNHLIKHHSLTKQKSLFTSLQTKRMQGHTDRQTDYSHKVIIRILVC